MASDIDTIISGVMEREGGSKVTNDPIDGGGKTRYGISEKANPEAWKDGQVTEAEAREIYLKKYVVGPGFHRIPPSHKHTQAQLIDWGVNSGPMIAVQNLQEALKVNKDGVFGSNTLEALLGIDDRILNNLLVAARVRMVGRIVKRNPSQLRFLLGWLERALGFLN